MDVTAENLANAQTTEGANGQPYQRQEVVLQQVGAGGFGASARRRDRQPSDRAPAGGVQVAGIVADPTPDQQVYDPGNPDADAQGYVTMPNVNPVTEMVDLIAESRAYEANVTAMQTPSRCSPRPWSSSSDSGDPRSIAACSPSGVGRRPIGSAPGGAGRPTRSPATPAAPAAASATCSTKRSASSSRPQNQAASAAQALATGQATDPTAVVTAVENAAARDAARLQIRTKAVEADQRTSSTTAGLRPMSSSPARIQAAHARLAIAGRRGPPRDRRRLLSCIKMASHAELHDARRPASTPRRPAR